MRDFENSVDVIRPVVERLGDARDYQILGGIASVALRHPELSIDMDARELRVPNLVLGTRRPNNSKRDADILVTTSNQERVQEVKAIAKEELQGKLALAVCSIHSRGTLKHLYDTAISRPIGSRSFTSDRFEANAEGTAFEKVLSPFAVPLDAATLEQWRLIINDEYSFPVSHPGATLANYTQRSLSGIRPKDYDKTLEAAANLFAKEPELLTWLKDGPGDSQMRLTQILYSLRIQQVDAIQILGGVELPILTHQELADSPYFMAPHDTEEDRARSVAFAAFKARRNHAVESKPWLVNLLNHGIVEKGLGKFVNND